MFVNNKRFDCIYITNKTLKRSNTLGINNESGFGLRFISSKQLLFKDIKETEKPKKIYNHKSNKQLEIIAKFRYSLNAQLEKAKKSIENISFKSSQNCTFEDIRDSQLLHEKKENYKRYKKFKSSKYNHYFTFNNLNNEESKGKDSNENKKTYSTKNIIVENEFEDIFEGAEEIEAIKRLNKAYAKYEKQNS